MNLKFQFESECTCIGTYIGYRKKTFILVTFCYVAALSETTFQTFIYTAYMIMSKQKTLLKQTNLLKIKKI